MKMDIYKAEDGKWHSLDGFLNHSPSHRPTEPVTIDDFIETNFIEKKTEKDPSPPKIDLCPICFEILFEKGENNV